MAVRDGDTGLSAAAGRVAEHARRLAFLEVELAKAEVKRKAGAAAFGMGLGVAAALFALSAFFLVVATATAALALVLPVWAATLVAAGACLLIAGALGAAAAATIRRSRPVPEQAIEEARRTAETLKVDAGH